VQEVNSYKSVGGIEVSLVDMEQLKEFLSKEYDSNVKLHSIETKEEYFEDNKVLALDDFLAYLKELKGE